MGDADARLALPAQGAEPARMEVVNTPEKEEK
jgi:hypothetical protein